MARDTFPEVLIRPDGTFDTDRYLAIAAAERREELHRVFGGLRALFRHAPGMKKMLPLRHVER